MPTVTLREITRDNWLQCVKLELSEDQRNFVATNVFSLSQAAYEPGLLPLAIYDGDTMVGFTMYGTKPQEGHYWIVRVMIDLHQQNKGYGRAAMTQIIERMKELPDCHAIYLDYNKQNTGAAHLYQSMGFVKLDGSEQEHEYVARLELLHIAP